MTKSGSLIEFASAKLNLFLHVTGRRPDGYHDISSLIVFTKFGDRLTARLQDRPGGEMRLEIAGPMAGPIISEDNNLVLQAAKILRNSAGNVRPCVDFQLEKHIPVAAGLGGGSADAAATLRALNQLWQLEFSDHELEALALPLGADVPVCIASRASLATGIGETLVPAPQLPELFLLLVNPGVAVPTPKVFQTLGEIPQILEPEIPSGFADSASFVEFLHTCRNDLEAPAIKIAGVIGDVSKQMRGQPDCMLARMSGSGATIFGLFPDKAAGTRAANNIRRSNPTWWVKETSVPATK
ncbi:MAG: 4-(cytidine 5'-diphospho)-2-C-methyl-D-erythritol kinase [Rhizobiales bacterium]|nr:4-(cytidine 5'-diphospho)-2-C-methyl-D-erythritol kinase [Hyphomicrobiales bacterium]